MRKILTYALLTLAFLPATAQENGGDDHNFEVAKNLDVFATIYKHLDLMYVDTLDANEVIGTGIKAMLRSLDPYTEYYPQEKMEDVTQMRTGTYAGVGAVIRKNLQTGRVMVSEPYEGMPAAEAGLRRGDVLLAIDDEDLTGKEVSYVSSRLRGDAGTSFIVTVERPGVKKPLKLKVTRRAIQTPVIPHYGMQTDDIGYLNLNQFTQNCSRDVRRALLEMKREGMQKLILDLRNNGGGSEQEAVNIVNMFVPKGKLIVSNRGKLKQANHDYLTTVEPIDSVMPVVVLVNGESASASEITAGALQDLDRAVILGTRTYGKGLVQMTMDLPYNGVLKLTTNKYYIPSGRCIQAINYRHSQGGYVEHVSDSLTKVFHTAGGREVRDGGGILPDVVVTPDSMTNIVGYLMYGDSAEVVHNYIMDYVSAHPTIAPARDFKLTDADFDDFKQRVLKSKFNYDRSTENYLESLEKLARFEGYYDDAKEEFAQLRAKLKHNIAKDLEFNRETLKELIANEIVTVYYFQRGSVEQSLTWDNQMKEAVRLLQSEEEYKNKLIIDN
ncbi:MAG: S41 family peptidase [Prevotella sp.]|nr:S41 family peptidase [Prevotella sp.]MBR6494632.1 S41 family peptidase [Prevotella sp.]